MIRALFLSIILCSILWNATAVNAQQPFINGCSSAGNQINPVRFNCDYSGAVGNGVILHLKGQSDIGFSVSSMYPVNNYPFYEFTYETGVSFSANPSVLEYYFSVAQDTFIITQSPRNANNQFPPSMYKYANFIRDAQGDMAGGSAGNWLDLTDNGMTYSDSKLYCYLKNVSGTWPQSQFLTYFAYTFGFLISSATDTSYYALVYANVPLLISSGLYTLNRTDSTYTRLGDISYLISNGALHMTCYLSEFTADPAWPGWPPPEGYIIPMGATLTASLSGQFINDITYPAIFQPETQNLDFGSNHSPALFSARIETDSGVSLTPGVTYLDSDNNLPLIRKFHFDSNSYDLNCSDHTYSDSSEFQTQLSWPDGGWHHFYFEFSDGVDTVRTAPDSILIPLAGCVYLTGDINGVGGPNGVDVVFGVSYFKGGPPPPFVCECLSHPDFNFLAGDVNGSCTFSGVDVTYYVTYLKGGPPLRPCPDCPPVGFTPPSPLDKPAELPAFKSDIKINADE